jgi:hypothetical protein
MRRIARLSRLSTVVLAIAAAPIGATPACAATVASLAPLAPAPTAWASRVEASVASARTRTLDACKAKGIALPKEFLAWVDGDPVVRTTVYGCRADPLPVLLALRSLEIDLGESTVRRDYTQLALAFAVQDSYAARGASGTPWNDADGAKPPEALPDVSPRAPLSLVIPADPRVRIDTKDSTRTLDRDDHIVNFLEDHAPVEVEIEVKEPPPLEYDAKGVAKPQENPVAVKKLTTRPLVGADVIASRALQEEFNAYMAAHGHGEVTLDCGDGAVSWRSTGAVSDTALRGKIAAAHSLFHDAYRAKGRMPAARDRAQRRFWQTRNFDPLLQRYEDPAKDAA